MESSSHKHNCDVFHNPKSYGIWRKDLPKKDGFSHELISPDSLFFSDCTDLDTLDAYPFVGVNTLHLAMKMNVELNPDSDWFGSYVESENSYLWFTYKEISSLAENMSYGIMANNLCPVTKIEGEKF